MHPILKAGVLLVFVLVTCVRGHEAIEETLNSTFYDYDKNARPFYGEKAVRVGVTIHILSVSKVDTSNQEFTTDFYFRQSWTDPRLVFQPKPLVSNMTLESDYMRRMWVPDTFFINEVTSTFHSTTVTNELVRLRSNGDVTKSMRLTVTATCPMTLREFPFDNPVCILHIESFSSGVNDIVYEWTNKPSVTVGSRASTGDFTLEGYRLDTAEIEALPPIVGNYSRITMHIQLKRILGRYHTDFYSPTLLLVLLSLFTLWFGSQKLSLALATVNLITLTVLSYVQSLILNLPKWADHNWLDTYTRLGSTFIIFVITANVLEINVPPLEIQLQESDDEETGAKGDKKKENRSASVSAEDAKLVRGGSNTLTNPQENSNNQILVLKSKLHFWMRKAQEYYIRWNVYIKYVLLVLFLLSNFVYWKSVPDYKPLPRITYV